jgi:hypothetical protein
VDTGCKFLKTSLADNKLGENDGPVMSMYHDSALISLLFPLLMN